MIMNKMFHNIDNYLLRQSKYFNLVSSIVQIVILGFVDYSIGYKLSFSIFYIIPIMLSTWYISSSAGIFMSLLAAAAWLTADLTSGNVYHNTLTPFWNCGVRFSFFLVITILTASVKKKLEQEEALADTDYLTGIKNSRSFYEHLQSESLRSMRYHRPFTLAYIDIDNFKQINDSFGHDVGDEVLKIFSKVMHENIRQSDIISRLGGDEFAALFPETNFDASEAIIQNLLPILRKAITDNGWPVTFSIGAVTFEGPLDSLREMVKKVDDLMYRVKKTGKNNIVHIECFQ